MEFTLATDLNNVQLLLLAVAITWSVIWKGFALWKSARNGQTAWFIALLVINTAGLLEIVYISLFQRKRA